MAINKTPVSAALRLELQNGTDDEGNPVYKTKTLNNLKINATPQQVHDAANALAGLQSRQVNALYQVDVNRLQAE